MDAIESGPPATPTLYRTTGAFDPRLQEVVVFGGGSSAEDQNITWAWDGSDWTQLSPAKSPSAREGLGTIWDPANQRFLVFGGMDFTTGKFYGDTWTL